MWDVILLEGWRQRYKQSQGPDDSCSRTWDLEAGIELSEVHLRNKHVGLTFLPLIIIDKRQNTPFSSLPIEIYMRNYLDHWTIGGEHGRGEFGLLTLIYHFSSSQSYNKNEKQYFAVDCWRRLLALAPGPPPKKQNDFCTQTQDRRICGIVS
jgi:hypothetical protein